MAYNLLVYINTYKNYCEFFNNHIYHAYIKINNKTKDEVNKQNV